MPDIDPVNPNNLKEITITPSSAAPAPATGGDTVATNSGFCGSEERVSTNICNSLHPAVCFDPSGNIGVTWSDTRDGNSEIYFRAMQGHLSEQQVKLLQGSAFNPSTGKAYNTSCEAFSTTTSSTDSSNLLITQSGGRLDVNTISRVMVLTAAQGSVDFQTLGVTTNSSIKIINGLNVGKTFYVSKILSPNVIELNFIDGSLSDDGFVYSVSRSINGLSTSEVRLTCNPASSQFPDIVADSQGRFHIVFQDNSTGNYELYYTQIYPKSVGVPTCTGELAPINVTGFSPVDPGTPGSININIPNSQVAVDNTSTTQTTPPTPSPVRASFAITGKTGTFFSYGNKLLPDQLPVTDGPILTRTGLHRLFRDFFSGTGEWAGVSRADDRSIWDAQATALAITVAPDFIVPVGHPLAGLNDFGTKFSFKNLAFIAQTPPDKSVEITRIQLPLKPKCLPDEPANSKRPDIGSLISAPMKPVPPGFTDPVSLEDILNSSLVQIDESVPPRFTIEGDSSGTVFTNILTDNGRGELHRFVFNCEQNKTEQIVPRFILGQVLCGDELCALNASSTTSITEASKTVEYKIRLQVWQGPDYRLDASQIESAKFSNVVKLIDKEFTFEPGGNIQSFDFKPGELKAEDGKYLFFVPIPSDGVEFLIEGVGGGHALWSTDSLGVFDQYYVPFTIQPNTGLNVPVYYEGILQDATSGATVGGGGSGQGGLNDSSNFSIDVFTNNFNSLWNGYLSPGANLNVAGSFRYDVASIFKIDNDMTAKTLRIPIVISNTFSATQETINQEVINVKITSIKAAGVQGSPNQIQIPDESVVLFSTVFPATTLPQQPPQPPNLKVGSEILIDIPVNTKLPAGQYAILIQPRNNAPIFPTHSSAIEYRMPIATQGIVSPENIDINTYFVSGARSWTTNSWAKYGPFAFILTGDGKANVSTANAITPSSTPTESSINNLLSTPVATNQNPQNGNQFPLGVTAVGKNVILNWSKPTTSTTDVFSYKIYRQKENASAELIATLKLISNTEQYIDTVSVNGTVLYQIEAYLITDTGELTFYALSSVGIAVINLDTTNTNTTEPSAGSAAPAAATPVAGSLGDLIAAPPIRLTKSSGDSVHPRLAIDAKDNIWLAYYSNRTGTNEVYLGRYFCGQWATSNLNGTDIRVTRGGDKGFYSQVPNITMDEFSNVHLVYESTDTEDGNSEIFYVRSTGGTEFLSPKQITASPSQAQMPDIAISSRSAISSSANSNSCNITANDSATQGIGRTIVVWHDNRFGNYQIMSASKLAGEWESSGQGGVDTRITQTTSNSLFPRIAADNHGNFRVVYHDFRRGLSNPWIFMSTFVVAENRWDSSAQGGSDSGISVGNTTFESRHPDIAIDITDGIYVAYHDTRFSAEEDVKEEVVGSYCARLAAPIGFCGPICANVEAFVQTSVEIVDPIHGKPIESTNVNQIGIQVTSPSATFVRISNDDGEYSDWMPFQPQNSLDTMVIPWELSAGSGIKKVCIQVQDATTVGFPICKDIVLQGSMTGFKIEFFRDQDLTTIFDSFNNMPAIPEGDVFVRLTSSAPLIQPPTFDVVNRGLRIISNQETTLVTGFSSAAGLGAVIADSSQSASFSAFAGTVFKARFHVHRDDGLYHLDGHARLIPHGKDIQGNVF